MNPRPVGWGQFPAGVSNRRSGSILKLSRSVLHVGETVRGRCLSHIRYVGPSLSWDLLVSANDLFVGANQGYAQPAASSGWLPGLALAYPHRLGLAYWVEAGNRRANAMRYLLAVCFLAIVAFADASPAAAQQNCACFCRVQGEGGGGCWVDVPGCNPRSGVRACNNGAMCGYNCGTPGLPARRSAPRAHPLGQHYQPTKQ